MSNELHDIFEKLTPEQIELLRRFKRVRYWKLPIPENDDIIFMFENDLLRSKGKDWNDIFADVQITKQGLAAVKYHNNKARQK